MKMGNIFLVLLMVSMFFIGTQAKAQMGPVINGVQTLIQLGDLWEWLTGGGSGTPSGATSQTGGWRTESRTCKYRNQAGNYVTGIEIGCYTGSDASCSAVACG